MPAGPDRKGADWTSKSTSITGAEVRWLFRNRKDKAVQDHVQFWMAGKPCVPPWEQSPELKALWSTYKAVD